MDVPLAESRGPKKQQNLNNFIGRSYEVALNQSALGVLDSLHKPGFDLTASISSFQRLLQSTTSPPLETIWVYSCLTFLNIKSEKYDSFGILSATKDLFQTITSCSALCSCSNSIALVAPVIYNVYNVVMDLKSKELKSKRKKKMMREIKGFVDVILGYINVCCGGLNGGIGRFGDSGLNSDELIRPLKDLVRVWIGDNVIEDEGLEGLRLFFPFLCDDILERLSRGECGLSELAGFVIWEAFLLKLCLKFQERSARTDLQNDLRAWSIGSITGFGNVYFFETLTRTLLEPSLPVTSLLNSDDEIFLRKILYDAAILAEYCFLNPRTLAHVPAELSKNLALARLIITNEAMEVFRQCKEFKKAVNFANAFSSSHLPSHLIKLVTTESEASTPNGSSPKAFLKWLIDHQNQGIHLFENRMLKYCAKLVLDDAKKDYDHAAYKESEKKMDNDLFFIDNEGETEEDNENEKMIESCSASFLAAARTIQNTEQPNRRKRKEGNLKKRKRVKFVKYNLYDVSNLAGDSSKASKEEISSTGSAENSSSGSEVEDPILEDDMEEIIE